MRRALVLLCIAAASLHAGLASGVDLAGPEGASQGAGVYTRGIVGSSFEEEGGMRFYIRVKLAAARKLPFSTITYLVPDRALVAGLREGDSVAFRAERRGGENVLTAIRPVAPCQRFTKCD